METAVEKGIPTICRTGISTSIQASTTASKWWQVFTFRFRLFCFLRCRPPLLESRESSLPPLSKPPLPPPPLPTLSRRLFPFLRCLPLSLESCEPLLPPRHEPPLPSPPLSTLPGHRQLLRYSHARCHRASLMSCHPPPNHRLLAPPSGSAFDTRLPSPRFFLRPTGRA